MSGGSRKTGEAGSGGGFLGLGPAPGLLVLEAEAGDDADHGPAPVVQVEERGRAADGLVVGVGGDVDDLVGPIGADYAPIAQVGRKRSMSSPMALATRSSSSDPAAKLAHPETAWRTSAMIRR